MAQIHGTTSTRDYHEGNPPWSKQKRAKPLQTWSGTVVYKRNKHVWHMKDVERIAKKVEIDTEVEQDDWIDLFLRRAKEVYLLLLEKVLWFLGPREVRGLYDFVEQLVNKLRTIDVSVDQTQGVRIIYGLASLFKLEITIKIL